jgi:protoporphyrinogen IX oxidase
MRGPRPLRAAGTGNPEGEPARADALTCGMLWLKAFHIVFVVTWFAGLFYLPRLFVYHSVASDQMGRERFVVMERRLFVMMTMGGALAIAFGASMVAAAPAYLGFMWLRVKLVLVAALVVYHFWCYGLMCGLRDGRSSRSQRWYRTFNEVPALFLIAIVVLAVVKP